MAEGQLISKCFLGVFNSSKKSTSLLWYLKSNCFHPFLGQLKTPKRHFEINWTLDWSHPNVNLILFRGVGSYLKLGGAQSIPWDRVKWSAKTWEGNHLPYPPISYAPKTNQSHPKVVANSSTYKSYIWMKLFLSILCQSKLGYNLMFNLVHMMKNNSSHKIAKYVKIRLKNSFLITLVLGDAKFTPDKKLNNKTKSKAYLQTLYLFFLSQSHSVVWLQYYLLATLTT